MHPNTPPQHELEKLKQELLGRKRTVIENKKLQAVSIQLEKIYASQKKKDENVTEIIEK